MKYGHRLCVCVCVIHGRNCSCTKLSKLNGICKWWWLLANSCHPPILWSVHSINGRTRRPLTVDKHDEWIKPNTNIAHTHSKMPVPVFVLLPMSSAKKTSASNHSQLKTLYHLKGDDTKNVLCVCVCECLEFACFMVDQKAKVLMMRKKGKSCKLWRTFFVRFHLNANSIKLVT